MTFEQALTQVGILLAIALLLCLIGCGKEMEIQKPATQKAPPVGQFKDKKLDLPKL